MNNVIFLGTSHIARQSLNDVRKYIEHEKPDIVALELDKRRMQILLIPGPKKIQLRSIRHIGLKGFLFSSLGAWAEQKLGKMVGVAPGSEMKQAIKIAKKKNLQIALVDQNIEVTLQRLSKSITWKEKLNFVVDILKSPFTKERIEFDLATVPDRAVIKKLTNRLKQRYPSLHKVLIEERNEVIAKNVKQLSEMYPDKRILVIIGAGHVEDVIEILQSLGNIRIRYSYTFDSSKVS